MSGSANKIFVDLKIYQLNQRVKDRNPTLITVVYVVRSILANTSGNTKKRVFLLDSPKFWLVTLSFFQHLLTQALLKFTTLAILPVHQLFDEFDALELG